MSQTEQGVGYWHALLVLGRISNLPTVWSNCLAAWLLGGGGPWSRFGLLCVGATLLYTGGMFLNDAFDVEFDRKFRPERPIVAGAISAKSVWVCSVALLAMGWLAILPLGRGPGDFATLLLITIVVYDAIHKRTAVGPVLMAGCRLLLYLLAATAAHRTASPASAWAALALAAYIIGLSYLARGESTGVKSPVWPLALLTVPIALALIGNWKSIPVWLLAAGQGGWIIWCLCGGPRWPFRWLSHGISGLLAGIVLGDWLAVAGIGSGLGFAFASLFLLALVTQRIAPAT